MQSSRTILKWQDGEPQPQPPSEAPSRSRLLTRCALRSAFGLAAVLTSSEAATGRPLPEPHPGAVLAHPSTAGFQPANAYGIQSTEAGSMVHRAETWMECPRGGTGRGRPLAGVGEASTTRSEATEKRSERTPASGRGLPSGLQRSVPPLKPKSSTSGSPRRRPPAGSRAGPSRIAGPRADSGRPSRPR